MKKVLLALGLFAFLLAGTVAVDTAVANDVDKVVYDDPPKTAKKGDKSCADYTKKSSCCSSKSADLGKKDDCSDKEEAKSTKVSTTTASADTKKASPDKK